MAHGITNIDKGVVHGTTWHRLPQYVQQEFPVTHEQAIEVLDYPIEKRQLVRGNGSPAEAWEVVRADADLPLVPHVGKDFAVLSNRVLFEHIAETVLCEFPDITIESVGTLFGGATAFVNLAVGEFRIKGDQSKSVSRLMYYNPLGKGKYKVCAHNVRVVCNNTLRLAHGEAAAAGLMRSASHTATAEARIKASIAEMLAVREAFREEQAFLDALAGKSVSADMLNGFFSAWLPIADDASKAAVTRRENLIGTVTAQFESDQGIAGRNLYGLLNAVTYVFDHEEPKRGNDIAAVAWDGIVGGRADDKARVADILRGMVAA